MDFSGNFILFPLVKEFDNWLIFIIFPILVFNNNNNNVNDWKKFQYFKIRCICSVNVACVVDVDAGLRRCSTVRRYRSRCVSLCCSTPLSFSPRYSSICTPCAVSSFSPYERLVVTWWRADFSGGSCLFGAKAKVLPEPQGPLGGADLRFCSPQPEPKSKLQFHGYGSSVSHVVPVPIYTAWWAEAHVCIFGAGPIKYLWKTGKTKKGRFGVFNGKF